MKPGQTENSPSQEISNVMRTLADTVGAVSGQIAGARLGPTQIPESWLNVLAWKHAIIEMGRKLYHLS
jgi:hypothetical protein